VCDARRPDLIEDWHGVVHAIRSYVLWRRLKLLTWQGLAAFLATLLPKCLAMKYGMTTG
jgi:hypothetical protein